MFELKPIKLLPVREQVVSTLRKVTISRQIAEEEVLTLETMAQNLGMLVAPVKEALQILAKDGLIDLKQNKGAVVLGINETTIREHCQVRMALESMACAICCEEMVPLEAIENCLTPAREVLEADDSSSYSNFNQSFYYEIWMAIGNEKSKNMLPKLWNGLSVGIKTTEHEHTRKPQEEYERIFETLKTRDVDKASNEMRRHILRSMEDVLTRYQ